jgi:hypothetical protein
MQHDWPLTLPWLDESRTAWSEIVRFVERHRAGRAVRTPLPASDAREDAGTIERSPNFTRDVQNNELVASR